jgi:hypothetical protein
MSDIIGSTRSEFFKFRIGGAAARRPLPLVRPCVTLNCTWPALSVSWNIHPQYYCVPPFPPLVSRVMPGHVILSVSSIAQATNRTRNQGRSTPWSDGSQVNRTIQYVQNITQKIRRPPDCTEHQKLVRFVYGTYFMKSTCSWTLSDNFL